MRIFKTALLAFAFILTTGAMALPYATSSADNEQTQQEMMSLSSRVNPANRTNFDGTEGVADQYCITSTWCPRGYKIWCQAEGYWCETDKQERSWIWCGAYDEWNGLSYSSSDRCY